MTIYDVRLLTDENIDAEVVEYLRQQGFDVLHIKENKWFSLPDRSILELANKEQRVVVSQDSDFGTLVFRDEIPFLEIIYLATYKLSKPFFLLHSKSNYHSSW